MEIKVERKIKPFHTGEFVYVPICTTAKVFAKIAGTVNLSEETVRLVKMLDYKVVQERLEI